MNDELQQFLNLVERMRQMQKDYFRHRQPESLQASKELEKQVDKFIEQQKSGDLFRERSSRATHY